MPRNGNRPTVNASLPARVSALLERHYVSAPLNLKGIALLVRGVLIQQGIHRVIAFEPFQLDLETEIVGAVRIDQGLFKADLISFVELEEDVVEGLAAFIDSLLHRFFERVDFCLLDEVFHARCIQHDFERRHTPPIEGGNEAL